MKKTQEKKQNKCLNCGKDIPDNMFCCNEKCVREYYNKKFILFEKKCKNPECKNGIPNCLDYCSYLCVLIHKQIRYESILKLTIKKIDYRKACNIAMGRDENDDGIWGEN